MLNICILDAKTLGDDIDLSIFRKFGNLSIYDITGAEDVAKRINDQEIIITNKVVLNESNLGDAPNVKLICIAATGVNNVDLNYTRSRGITVTNVKGYSTNSVAQHTFALLFYILEQLGYYDKYTKSGEYCKSRIFDNLDRPYWELSGKTWGIIGLGTIGVAVAKIAAAFGCRVVYYSTTGNNNNKEFERMELEDLLGESDIVSIHAPLNPSTLNLINKGNLGIMKRHSILLNLGRGGIVNEKDLADALNNGLIAGAALDVLEHEPMENESPLLKIEDKTNILVTPHIAWASKEARIRLIDEIQMNIDAFLRNEERNKV